MDKTFGNMVVVFRNVLQEGRLPVSSAYVTLNGTTIPSTEFTNRNKTYYNMIIVFRNKKYYFRNRNLGAVNTNVEFRNMVIIFRKTIDHFKD